MNIVVKLLKLLNYGQIIRVICLRIGIVIVCRVHFGDPLRQEWQVRNRFLQEQNKMRRNSLNYFDHHEHRDWDFVSK